jgi:hypothetical protein
MVHIVVLEDDISSIIHQLAAVVDPVELGFRGTHHLTGEISEIPLLNL